MVLVSDDTLDALTPRRAPPPPDEFASTTAPYQPPQNPSVGVVTRPRQPRWDEAVQGYNDDLGHVSYDGGNTWMQHPGTPQAQGPVDYTNPNPGAWTPEPIPPQAPYQGPVDYTNDNPAAWTPAPVPPSYEPGVGPQGDYGGANAVTPYRRPFETEPSQAVVGQSGVNTGGYPSMPDYRGAADYRLPKGPLPYQYGGHMVRTPGGGGPVIAPDEGLGGRFGRALGAAGQVMDAGVKYATGPLAAQVYGDPLGTLKRSALLGLGPLGAIGFGAGAAADTAQDYGANKAAYERFQQNENVPWAARNLVNTGLNPISLLGGAAGLRAMAVGTLAGEGFGRSNLPGADNPYLQLAAGVLAGGVGAEAPRIGRLAKAGARTVAPEAGPAARRLAAWEQGGGAPLAGKGEDPVDWAAEGMKASRREETLRQLREAAKEPMPEVPPGHKGAPVVPQQDVGAALEASIRNRGGVPGEYVGTNGERLTPVDTGSATSPQVESGLPKSAQAEAETWLSREKIAPTVEKLTDLIKAAKPARAETEALKHAELSQRVARASSMLERGSGEAAFGQAKSQLSGELPRAQFEAPRVEMRPEEVTSLFQHISDAPKQFFTKLNTADALTTTLTGSIPTRGQIALLEDMFGSDLAKALLAKRGLGPKAWETFVDVANLPRTISTAYDLSGSLRQGAILSAAHPIEAAKHFVDELRAFKSKPFADALDAKWDTGPNASLYERAALYRAKAGGVGVSATAREEGFISRLAQHLPGIQGSERAYVTYLNEMRRSVFDQVVKGWRPEDITDANLRKLGGLLNSATGRGTLPGALKEAGPALSAAFFSPRFFVSRGEWVGRVAADIATSPQLRKEAARELLAFVGTGVSALALLKYSGLANVELDPRSTNFGKARFGNTRVDYWAGFQPLVRYTTQLITGERKTSAGQIEPVPRLETLGHFTQSKLAPAPGAALDIARGKTAIGDEISASPGSLGNQAFNRFTPFFVQDLLDAAKEHGWGTGSALGALSGLGLGVQTYTVPAEQRDRLANDTIDPTTGKPFGKNWDELNRSQQDFINKSTETGADLKAASREYFLKTPLGGALQIIDDEKVRQEGEIAKTYKGPANGKQVRTDIADLEDNVRRDRARTEKDLGHGYKPPSNPLDKAVDDWYATYALGRQAPGGTRLDYDKLDRLQGALRNSWDAETKAYVDRMISGSTAKHDPLVTRLYDDKAKIQASGYWDLHDKLAAQFGSAYKLPIKNYQDLQNWLAAQKPDVRSSAESDYNSVYGESAKAWRAGHKDIRSILYQWGYINPGKEEQWNIEHNR